MTDFNTRRLQRALLAFVGSVCLHLAVLVLLLIHSSDRLKGQVFSRFDQGAGSGVESMMPIEVALISPKSDKSVTKTEVEVVTSAQDAAVKTETPLASLSEEGEATGQNSDDPDNNATEIDSIPSGAQGAVLVQASAGTIGAPDGARTLLDQIARCLPSGERPALREAKLDLMIDGTGTLSAVPRLDVDISTLTQDQIRAGNQIIQAALQCGPYKLPEATTAMIEIVPDFSTVTLAAP